MGWPTMVATAAACWASAGGAARGAPPSQFVRPASSLIVTRLPGLCPGPIRHCLGLQTPHRRYGHCARRTPGLPPSPGGAWALVLVCRRVSAPASGFTLPCSPARLPPKLSSSPAHCLSPHSRPFQPRAGQPLCKPALRRLAAAQPSQAALPPNRPHGQLQGAAPQTAPSAKPVSTQSRLITMILFMAVGGFILQVSPLYWFSLGMFICFSLL